MDNGIVKLTLTKPNGLISGVAYGGAANVLQEQFSDSERGLVFIKIIFFSFYILRENCINSYYFYFIF